LGSGRKQALYHGDAGMKKIIAIALLAGSMAASAYGQKAYFTGRMEYLGGYKVMCEYSYSFARVTVILQGTYCPYLIDI
jgi:hypothetical protein